MTLVEIVVSVLGVNLGNTRKWIPAEPWHFFILSLFDIGQNLLSSYIFLFLQNGAY